MDQEDEIEAKLLEIER